MTLKVTSQISPIRKTDSITCVPTSDLRKAAILIERGKLAIAERNISRDSSRTLLQKIVYKDSIIALHQEKDILNEKLLASFRTENGILERELQLSKDITVKTEKLYKRQKLKTIFTGITTVAITTAVFLIIGK